MGSAQMGSLLSFGLRWADLGARGSGFPDSDCTQSAQVWRGWPDPGGLPRGAQNLLGLFFWYSHRFNLKDPPPPVLGTQLPFDAVPVPERPGEAKLLLCAGTRVARATRSEGKFEKRGKPVLGGFSSTITCPLHLPCLWK